MLDRVPTVLTGQEILDMAFARANKIQLQDPDRYHRIRKTEAAKVQMIIETLAETLMRFPQKFPNLDHLRDYEKEVLDIIAGLPELRKALGSVRWAANKVQDLGRETMEGWARCRDVECFKRLQNRCYGRVSSIVYEIDNDLDFLRNVRDTARKMPSVSPGYATIVIAGYPNVGKSSLLTAWTRATPEINTYAFTTKKAEVGHFEVGDGDAAVQYQVVDTPGLLDRQDHERNDIERQAVAALRHAADALLFLIDPTETSGYSLKDQELLLAQVMEEMPGIPLVIAETKADLLKSETDRYKISIISMEGVMELRQKMVSLLPTEAELEEDPLDQWRKTKR